jgi:hypothetical protein
LGPVIKNGAFQLDETLHILPAGKITTTLAGGLTLNITGDLIIDVPSSGTGTNGISGDIKTTGTARPITINATGNIWLYGNGTKGAKISSNGLGSCSGGSIAGIITLIADSNKDQSGNVTTEWGSVISANGCSGGEIDIAGANANIDGLVESVGSISGTGARQAPGGGPIWIEASCDLTISNTGKVSSRGGDPGADLIHLEGCDVLISGIVESTGTGHVVPTNPLNHCNSNNRPDKPFNSTSCVEVWAGHSLTIDSTSPDNGEIKADTGGTGGSQGTGWIDLFAGGDINIIGDLVPFINSSVTPFSVHANGKSGTNDVGGHITVKSTAGKVQAWGLAIQAEATGSGSDGGSVIIEAASDVNLDTASLFARGDFAAMGGYGKGGTFKIDSFNGTLSWTSGIGDVRPTGADTIPPINVDAPSAASGKRGIITLQDCLPPLYVTLGATFPFNGDTPTTPTVAADACGPSGPTLPTYAAVAFPDCSACGGGTATLTVTKTLVPSNDTGTFNLQINGTTYATGGNGTSTGPQSANVGSNTVGETAAGSTNLANYTTLIGGDCAADGTITLAAGDNKTCTITNTFKTTPAISVTKQCQSNTINCDLITFSAVVTNTGNEKLNNITCFDTPTATELTGVPAWLEVGESATVTGKYQPASNPSTDKLTCSGTGVISNITVTNSGSATCAFICD